MAVWILGFVTGLMLGTTLVTVALQFRLRRMRSGLGSLIESGKLRLQTRSGVPASPAETLAAIDVALGLPPGQPAPNRVLLVVLALACAIVTASSLLVVASSG
jgi:hypothetical protein